MPAQWSGRRAIFALCQADESRTQKGRERVTGKKEESLWTKLSGKRDVAYIFLPLSLFFFSTARIENAARSFSFKVRCVCTESRVEFHAKC